MASAPEDSLTIDQAVEAVFGALCQHYRAAGAAAQMTRAELRRRAGVDETTFNAALRALRGPRDDQDLKVAFVDRDPDRIVLGASWRGRCEDCTSR